MEPRTLPRRSGTSPSGPHSARILGAEIGKPKWFEVVSIHKNRKSSLPDTSIFRKEALASHEAKYRWEGDLLRISPAWMTWAYRLLVGCVAVALLYSILATVNEYASGPAVIRITRPSPPPAPFPRAVTPLQSHPPASSS